MFFLFELTTLLVCIPVDEKIITFHDFLDNMVLDCEFLLNENILGEIYKLSLM